jgi:hypothetical protein
LTTSDTERTACVPSRNTFQTSSNVTTLMWHEA